MRLSRSEFSLNSLGKTSWEIYCDSTIWVCTHRHCSEPCNMANWKQE